jgi:hypothetical protein
MMEKALDICFVFLVFYFCLSLTLKFILELIGQYMYLLLRHTKSLHFASTVYLCVPYGSHSKERLFP